MPGEGSEKKKIAELYFGVEQAKNDLKVIDDRLQGIIDKTKKLDLGKNLQIDSTKIKSGYKNLDDMINKYGKNVTNTYLKGVNIAEKAEKAKEVAAYKSMLKQEEYNNRLANSAQAVYSKIANYANTYLIYQGFNILKQAAKELVDEMVDVEYQMVQIDRVLNESSLDIDKYRDRLIQLAYDYGNSFDNVADVTLRLAQAGLDSEQAISLTEKTLLALNTAELDATEATSDMIAVMSQWNLLTGDAAEVSENYASIIDKINRVADNFPTTSADILDALKKTSSAFNIAGASIDETIASIVAAEKASQRGGKAIGTALNSIVQQLKTEGRLATMEGLGIELYTDETKTEFKSVMEILEQLAEKMEQLKKAGKESSVEMQDLMTVFTVMRRNIGSSLLGEMAGEDSTYQKVLDMVQAYDTIGYSMQENEKHMGTAKAAIEQFNAELLKLKTEIWENGGEDVFKGLITLGTTLIEVITELVKIFGKIPSTLSVVTSAFSALGNALNEVKIIFESINYVIEKSKEASEFIQKMREDYANGGIGSHLLKTYTDLLSLSLFGSSSAISSTIEIFADYIATEEEAVESTEELAETVSEDLEESVRDMDSILKSGVASLKSYAEQYSVLESAMNEYNASGAITADTFEKLVNNNLLQYLDVVNGQLRFNSQELLNSANDAKQKAIADLQAEAAAEILAIAQADYNKTLSDSTQPTAAAIKNVEALESKALSSAKAALTGAASWKEFYSALEKSDKLYYSGLSENAQNQINNVISNLSKKVGIINSISLSAAKSSGSASRSATKTFEEQSAERVKIFKKEIDDLEKLEQSWVNKYKKLELFSTSDLKFITHQRINRFNEYLNQINQLQGISEEDRTELIREYSAKRQEAELEYFDLLKDQLDDQIKQLEKANKEKIDLIKKEAQAQIDSLKKVEDENDRIRQKEEYERKRQELIYGHQGIEYWQQRTGREAQIALAKAQQELEDLDRDWEEKKQDWNLDDQIEQIEKARDAQIKAIEDAQEIQIAGWKAAYEAQVQLYAQTGQIIYDDSIINATYLYNAYMDNFVAPFHEQLRSVINSINQASVAADGVINKMNSIASGGGSTGSVSNAVSGANVTNDWIVRTTGTLVKEANAAQAKFVSATNNISLGGSSPYDLKKKVGKFHGGGMVGSQGEALALLRPREVVLTPEWAAGMNRLVKSINEGKFSGNNGTTNNIDIQGNLVNLEANIKNRQDADYLTDKIEKVLRDKFNIRK